MNDHDDKHAREREHRAHFEEWHTKRGLHAPPPKSPAEPFPLPPRNIIVSTVDGTPVRCRVIERATPEAEAHTAQLMPAHRISRHTIWLVDLDDAGVKAADMPNTRFMIEGAAYYVVAPPHRHPVLGWKLRLMPDGKET